MTSNNFIDKTMDHLDSVTPVSRVRVIATNVIFGSLILLLSFSVAWLLSSYIYDIVTTFVLHFRETSSLDSLRIGDTLLELVLAAVVMGVIAILLYRRTDWPLVRNTGLIITILLLFAGVGGGVLATFAADSFLQTPSEVVDQLPYRRDRPIMIQQRLREKNRAAGKIISINSHRGVLRIESAYGIEEFSFSSQITNIERFQVGDIVLIDFEENSETKSIIMIRKLPPREKRRRIIQTIIGDRR